MLTDVIDALRCPHCAQRLDLVDVVARCPAGHAFDVARQGYLNLLGGAGGIEGDTAAMVAARHDFLAAGHYSPIREALVEETAGDGLVAEIGAGTAYYLGGVVDAAPARTGVALDVSRFAARRAARAHPRIGSVVCDAWRGLPLRDGVATTVLDVFAPRNASEIARVLAPGGRLLVVTPDQEHLTELIGALGLIRVDAAKQDRLDTTLDPTFLCTGRRQLVSRMRLDHPGVGQLVAMGPSARHLDPPDLASRIAGLPEIVEVTASMTLSTWVPRTDLGCG